LERGQVIKHWLLDLAVEHPVSLGLLFPHTENQGLNVKPIPNCGSDDYACGLLELFIAGLITLGSEFPADDVENRSGISKVLDRFLRLSSEDSPVRQLLAGTRGSREQPGCRPSKRVCFQLTARGGSVWEKVVEPDWDHFVSASTYSAIAGKCRLNLWYIR
jgi:hypothetical protein